MAKIKKEKVQKYEPVKREPYTFVAYVSGPIYKFDVSAKDFDEAYGMALRLLRRELEKYEGKARVDRIELIRFSDDIF